MLLYKRYLLKKITSYFVVVLTILICLIWFTRAISFVKFITEKGISITSFLQLFILILPWLSLLIIPISLFIAILISYGRMNSSNEITILKNSGLTKIQIIKPAIIVACFMSLFCYLISLYLMPMANKNLKLAKKDFQHNYANIMISPGIFESLNNLTIYVNDRDENNKLFGVLLYDTYSKESTMTLSAKDGKLIEENGSILMLLRDGSLQKYNIKERNSEILYFDEYVVNLSQNNKVTNFNLVWKAAERYLHELIYPEEEETSQEILNSYRVEIHQRLTYPLFSVILTLIACAFILKGDFSRRGSAMNNINAVFTACIFISITMVSYDLMEKSSKYDAVLYSNFVFFVFYSIYLLKTNFRGKNA